MKVTAPDWVMLILVVLILWQVKQWHDRTDPRPATTHVVATADPRTPALSTVPNPNRREIGTSRELIRAVSETYDVPSGLIFGIWMKESNGLRSGFGTGAGWYRAPELVASGGRCLREYDAARCDLWWRGLQAVCAQVRDGRPICDPNEVRTSYAYAMGPMQVLPSVILDVRPDGTTSWTANAADFDRDGVVDPHSLPDAMAIAALEIRHRFERAPASTDAYEAWITAANGYYGSQTAGYYEGTTAGRPGIQDYWRQWCEVPGNCRGGSAIASR